MHLLLDLPMQIMLTLILVQLTSLHSVLIYLSYYLYIVCSSSV